VPPIVRTKDLMKVKGMLINPTVLMDALRAVSEIDEFQVALTHQDPNDPLSMDEMVLRVATSVPDRDAFATRLVQVAQDAVRIRPRIEFKTASEIYDPMKQVKSVRLVDER
jgi:phenylacetate-coenzyme A ligase PaaK-like adenylate-forming protein